MKLFAANSFNLARLLPQTIYYFYAYAQLMRSGADLSRLVITTPLRQPRQSHRRTYSQAHGPPREPNHLGTSR